MPSFNNFLMKKHLVPWHPFPFYTSYFLPSGLSLVFPVMTACLHLATPAHTPCFSDSLCPHCDLLPPGEPCDALCLSCAIHHFCLWLFDFWPLYSNSAVQVWAHNRCPGRFSDCYHGWTSDSVSWQLSPYRGIPHRVLSLDQRRENVMLGLCLRSSWDQV